MECAAASHETNAPASHPGDSVPKKAKALTPAFRVGARVEILVGGLWQAGVIKERLSRGEVRVQFDGTGSRKVKLLAGKVRPLRLKIISDADEHAAKLQVVLGVTCMDGSVLVADHVKMALDPLFPKGVEAIPLETLTNLILPSVSCQAHHPPHYDYDDFMDVRCLLSDGAWHAGAVAELHGASAVIQLHSGERLRTQLPNRFVVPARAGRALSRSHSRPPAPDPPPRKRQRLHTNTQQGRTKGTEGPRPDRAAAVLKAHGSLSSHVPPPPPAPYPSYTAPPPRQTPQHPTGPTPPHVGYPNPFMQPRHPGPLMPDFPGGFMSKPGFRPTPGPPPMTGPPPMSGLPPTAGTMRPMSASIPAPPPSAQSTPTPRPGALPQPIHPSARSKRVGGPMPGPPQSRHPSARPAPGGGPMSGPPPPPPQNTPAALVMAGWGPGQGWGTRVPGGLMVVEVSPPVSEGHVRELLAEGAVHQASVYVATDHMDLLALAWRTFGPQPRTAWFSARGYSVREVPPTALRDAEGPVRVFFPQPFLLQHVQVPPPVAGPPRGPPLDARMPQSALPPTVPPTVQAHPQPKASNLQPQPPTQPAVDKAPHRALPSLPVAIATFPAEAISVEVLPLRPEPSRATSGVALPPMVSAAAEDQQAPHPPSASTSAPDAQGQAAPDSQQPTRLPTPSPAQPQAQQEQTEAQIEARRQPESQSQSESQPQSEEPEAQAGDQPLECAAAATRREEGRVSGQSEQAHPSKEPGSEPHVEARPHTPQPSKAPQQQPTDLPSADKAAPSPQPAAAQKADSQAEPHPPTNPPQPTPPPPPSSAEPTPSSRSASAGQAGAADSVTAAEREGAVMDKARALQSRGLIRPP